MVVLDSHARTGQPVLEEIRIASNYATQTVDDVIGLLGGDATLLSIRAALQLTPTTAVPPGSRQNRSEAQRASVALAACVTERSLRSIERRLFDLTWAATPADDEAWGRHEMASQHLASLIDLRGRHAASLELSIASAARSSGRSADSIYRCLSPETSLFQVVVVVEGTTALEGLGRLIPVRHDPQLIPLHATGQNGKGGVARFPVTTAFFRGPPEKLLDFVRQYARDRRSCLVSLILEATDAPTAGALGRREVLNVLDQYMAGDRLTDLRLWDQTLVNQPSTGRMLRLDLVGAATHRSYPLVNAWPEQLRGALHTSHLLRRTEAPMARAALAWVTLEAAGIEKDTISSLARALSLQCLRQELISAHDVLVRAVAAKRQLRRLRLNAAKADLHRFRITYRRATQIEQRDAAHAAAISAARDAIAERVLLRLHDIGPTQWLREIEAFLDVNDRGQMTDANRWLLLLLPKQSHESPDVGRARGFLQRLMEPDLPALIREVSTWSGRLSRPPSTADWLDRRESELEAFIHALRASRNQALHAGVFAVEGDRLLSDGAASLIDMTLEFLGNWYRQRRGTSSAEEPVDIVNELAARFAVVRDYLTGASDTDNRINLALLTSPLSDGMDRP